MYVTIQTRLQDRTLENDEEEKQNFIQEHDALCIEKNNIFNNQTLRQTIICGVENFDPKNRRTFEIGVKFEQDEIQDIWKNYCGGAVVATEEKSIDDDFTFKTLDT